ncbi:MAG: hypothetical protein CMJ47_00740 [Planctomyces sp.]|uniref:hypothetical protein n=1 Tax=Rubinisphaera sp. JC750 TaxID=2898658 RepID=UPI000C6155A4|nr:hypothetical protein [Rubinisphaera sp. JC750]MBB01152.1 hypothetical protein [Planctomyces sp.]
MGNYSVQKVRIRLSDEIAGLDPISEIDNEELAWIDSTGFDANSSGAQPLSDFYAADYTDWQEDDKWFPAETGVNSVQKMIKHYQRIIADGEDPMGRQLDVIKSKLAVLTSVEKILKIAADDDVYFCLAVS